MCLQSGPLSAKPWGALCEYNQFIIIHHNSCCNRLLFTVEHLHHRQWQLLPLYSSYVSNIMTNICYNQLLWVAMVRPFHFNSFYYDILNLIFGFRFWNYLEKRNFLWTLVLFRMNTIRLWRWVSTYKSVINSLSNLQDPLNPYYWYSFFAESILRH